MLEPRMLLIEPRMARMRKDSDPNVAGMVAECEGRKRNPSRVFVFYVASRSARGSRLIAALRRVIVPRPSRGARGLHRRDARSGWSTRPEGRAYKRQAKAP